MKIACVFFYLEKWQIRQSLGKKSTIANIQNIHIDQEATMTYGWCVEAVSFGL